MNRDTFNLLLLSIAEKCRDVDYPLCYTRYGQILTMSNKVLYIGNMDDSLDLVAELNRKYYQKDSDK